MFEGPPPIPQPEEGGESKWDRLIRDPDIRKGALALYRTLANMAISVGDFIPGAGEVASWTADALKSQKLQWLLNKIGIKKEAIDFTPAVSKKMAWGTELFELLFCGHFPTHSIETFLQLKNQDAGELRRALAALKEITIQNKQRDTARRSDIDGAMGFFRKRKK